jgi:hypothetical protein
MEFYALPFPLPPSDIERLERILERATLFRTSFDDLGSMAYRAATYRIEEAVHDTESCVLVDRNIISRLVALVRGDRATADHRLAAAVAAFAQCANMRLEPNLALYELAQVGSPSEAHEELHLFRIADEVDPRLYTDIALDRRDLIPAALLPSRGPGPEDWPDLAQPLRRWRSNYILALKLSALELQGGTAERKMRRFIDWMKDEFVFGGSATVFAHHYLAPGIPKKRMLKALRSPDRLLALRGARNAAWDLNLVTDWARHVRSQQQEKRLWVLCSRDASVQRIAGDILSPETPGVTTEQLAEGLFVRYWGSVLGKRLLQYYWSAATTLGHPGRRDHGRRAMESKDSFIAALEAEIVAWRP